MSPSAAVAPDDRRVSTAVEEPVAVTGMPLSHWGRCGMVVWALFLCAGFGLSAYLEPDPRGLGTHQQLGLPVCSIRLWLGIPCPSCGGTTAFAWFVRGNLIAAAEANLGAVILATASALMIPWSLLSARIGRLWKVDRPDLILIGIIGSFLAVSLIQWAVKVAVGG